MEGAPEQIRLEDVKVALEKFQHVKEVHDLHIWSITSGMPMLSCHISIYEKTAFMMLFYRRHKRFFMIISESNIAPSKSKATKMGVQTP